MNILELFANLFSPQKKETAAPAAQTPTSWSATQGPTGYTDAMRANLGLNVQQGGQSPTSGMAGVGPNAGTPDWYTPVAAAPNPLQALLGATPMPATPAATTPAASAAAATSTPMRLPTAAENRASGGPTGRINFTR